MKAEIVKFDTPELQGIEESKAKQIRATFEPMAIMLTEFENSYNEIIKEAKEDLTLEVSAKAKRLRIDIGKVRIESDKVRLAGNENSQREIKARNGVCNILKFAVIDKENKLKEIENYAEIHEQKRLEKLQSERAEKLSKYVEDAHERNLSGMDEDVWSAYFSTKKRDFEDKIAAEKKAESERIATEKLDKLEQSRKEEALNYRQFWKADYDFRTISNEQFTDLMVELQKSEIAYNKKQVEIKAENERLKKEADKKEKIRIEEENARQAKAEKERKEREAKEAKIKAENEAKLKAEREKREKVESELKAKAEKERQVRESRTAELRSYIVFIRDYNKMLSLPEDKYQKELSDVKKGAAQHYEYERKEADKKALEKERLQKLENEARQRAKKEKQDMIDKENRIQTELKKGDHAKIQDLKAGLISLKTQFTFKAKKNQIKLTKVNILIDKVVAFIDE